MENPGYAPGRLTTNSWLHLCSVNFFTTIFINFIHSPAQKMTHIGKRNGDWRGGEDRGTGRKLTTYRVRVGSQVSSWKTLCGSMPQGSRLGPLSFIVMIDNLRANCEVHKFVDVTTLSELIPPPNSPSNMTDYLCSLLIWTADNDMQINTSKTKEMILGRINSTFIPPLSTPAGPIQRVNTFKLLGLHLDAIVYPGPLTSTPQYLKQVKDSTS